MFSVNYLKSKKTECDETDRLNDLRDTIYRIFFY